MSKAMSMNKPGGLFCMLGLPILLAFPAGLPAVDFVRGDVDANGVVEITDAIRTLGYLFLGSPAMLSCDDAADSDDDGILVLTDAVKILSYLFTGGGAPPSPWGECGADPTIDELGCASFARCTDAQPTGAQILLNEAHPVALDESPELAEVRTQFPLFAHQLVELRILKEGTTPSGYGLRTESGALYTLPAGLPLLDKGAILLVIFDGKGSNEGSMIHSELSTFFTGDSDSLELLDAEGNVIDRVAWGDARSDGVMLGQGGTPAPMLANVSLTRRPGSDVPVDHGAWFVTAPGIATPGGPNRAPGVTILIPSNGGVLPAGERILSWYPAPGATGYRIQVAQSSDFNSPLLDETVERPPVTRELAEGKYFWRVQAQDASGAGAEWSYTSALQIVAPDDPDFPTEPPAGGEGAAQDAAQGPPPPQFPLILSRRPPLYEQRKDTPMLLLESDRPSGTRHAWNAAHPELDELDPADNCNCALATIQMMNGYFAQASDSSPILSQDRIGLEVHSSKVVELKKGPEYDFNFQRGLPTIEYAEGLKFALGATFIIRDLNTPEYLIQAFFDLYNPLFRETLWTDLEASLRRGIPVPCSRWTWKNATGGHASLIWGMQVFKSERFVLINDPWHAHAEWLPLNETKIYNYFLLPEGAAVSPRADEDELKNRIDSDGDKISNFDERMRFKTSFENPRFDRDTDGDCIEDFDEVERSVFADEHGWGPFCTGNAGYPARHSDGKAREGVQPELALDSDGGGLPDFVEDRDRDGKKDSGETDPYDPGDDRITIDGTLEQTIDLFCANAGPNTGYHDLTHKESSVATFHLTATENADRKGLVAGTVIFDFKGLDGFWISDTPADCGETGLSRTIDPYRWEGKFEARFVCKLGSNGPELHLEGDVAGEGPSNPKIHEHFCDYDFDARPNVAPARATSLTFLTWYVPGGQPKPIEGDHYENDRDLKSSGCYSGKIGWKLTLDLKK